MSVRDRLYERKFRVHMKALIRFPRKRIVHFIEGHAYQGTDTLHRSTPARKIRVLQRLKLNRN